MGSTSGSKQLNFANKRSWSDNRQGTEKNTISVYEDYEAFDSVLEFLYTGTYAALEIMTHIGERRDAQWIELLKKHADMFALADKYGMVALKDLAGTAINIAIQHSLQRLALSWHEHDRATGRG